MSWFRIAAQQVYARAIAGPSPGVVARLLRQVARAAPVAAALWGCTAGDSATSGAGGTSDATRPAPSAGSDGLHPAPSMRESAVSSAPLDSDVRRTVVEAIAQRLASDYVFEPVGVRMEHLLEERLEAKTYDTIADADELARVLTSDLRAVAQDKHLNVRHRLPGSLTAPPPASAYADTGIRKVEVLDGNIGYVGLDGVSRLEIAQRAVEAAFAMLQGSDALIIDNRENTGGDPRTVAWYVSHLSEGSPFVVSETHARGDARVKKIATTNVGARSYGKDRPVYVLTSPRTFSAGENLTYTLQALGRATVIGERTAGGAHPTRRVSLGHGFIAGIPFAETISAITGTNWEGVGVKPDVPVPAELALEEAERRAREAIASAAALRESRGEPPPRYGLNPARRGPPERSARRLLPLYNGDFSHGLAAWGVSAGRGASPSYGIKGGALCVAVAPRDHILVGWPPETSAHAVSLEAGGRYQLSFQAVAKGPLALDAEVGVGHRLPPYTRVVDAEIPLDATRRSYTVDFEPDADEPNGGIAFRVAARGQAGPTELCIDDVTIRERQN